MVLDKCAAVAGGWGASGTAANPGTSSVTYEITIFFTDSGSTVINDAQTRVTVAAGKTEKWSANAKFKPPSEVNCVLRGVG